MRARSGFTLVELSMVLVIIGLLTGGIVVGKSMLRQSQINSAVTDEQSYVQAFLQFQQKYGYLPGDFPNATNYWGAMTTCPPAAGAASQGGTLTCNGNGDGQILINTREMFFEWQHLANAQMIQGSYTGIAGSLGFNDSIPGINVPATRLEGTGIGINYLGVSSGNINYFDNNYGHLAYFGSYFSTAGGAAAVSPVLTGKEAKAIDVKYDDGSPASGQILGFKNGSIWNASCTTTTYASTADYTSASGPQCALIFITGF